MHSERNLIMSRVGAFFPSNPDIGRRIAGAPFFLLGAFSFFCPFVSNLERRSLFAKYMKYISYRAGDPPWQRIVLFFGSDNPESALQPTLKAAFVGR